MDETQPESKRPGSQTLRRNLAALDRVDPELARRLRWPVDDRALGTSEGGAVVYSTPGSDRRLALGPGQVEAARDSVGEAEEVGVFGIGLGEIPSALLEDPARRVVAWEREPALLRCALGYQDWSRPLRDGRLELRLAGDWGKLLHSRTRTWVRHPALLELYGDEWEARAVPLGSPRVVLQEGGLYVGSLSHSLRRRGYAVLRVDFKAWSAEELEHSLASWGPSFIACINWTEGLEEFARRLGLEVLCWEIDPSTTAPRPVAIDTTHVHIFSYRRAQVSAWRRAGYAHVESMSLAADLEKRRPDAEYPVRDDGPVTFVGSSLVDRVEPHRQRFLELHRRWCLETRRGDSEGRALARALVERQQVEGTPWQLDRELEAACPGFLTWSATVPPREDPAILLGEGPASHHRLELVASLAGHGIEVWGDVGWRRLESRGVKYRGPAAHDECLTSIYRESAINIDIARRYQADIVPMRVFDVLACGGFLLVEHSEDLERLFDVGREVVSYRSAGELCELVGHFLDRPDERRRFAGLGRKAVIERFSFDSRVDRMLAALHVRRPIEATRETA